MTLKKLPLMLAFALAAGASSLQAQVRPAPLLQNAPLDSAQRAVFLNDLQKNFPQSKSKNCGGVTLKNAFLHARDVILAPGAAASSIRCISAMKKGVHTQEFFGMPADMPAFMQNSMMMYDSKTRAVQIGFQLNFR